MDSGYNVVEEEQLNLGSRDAHLLQFTRQWSKPIKEGLSGLAKALWPDRHLLGLIPYHDYRMRMRKDKDAVFWWVEHDILPPDRYQCEAYRVRLALDAESKPVIEVQDGSKKFPVEPLRKSELWRALSQAGNDPPIILTRNMGAAIDP